MLKSLEEVSEVSEHIQEGLQEEIQKLICEPLEVVRCAASNANIPLVRLNFLIQPSKTWPWYSRFTREASVWYNGGDVYFMIDYLSDWHKGLSNKFTPEDILSLAVKYSMEIHPEFLDTLVNEVNRLGETVLASIQQKNELDESLRCRAGSTHRVNKALLDALDSDRLLIP